MLRSLQRSREEFGIGPYTDPEVFWADVTAAYQAEIQRASARPTDNMGSYDLYLRALPLSRTYAKAEVLKAIALLDRAIALDPNMAWRWASRPAAISSSSPMGGRMNRSGTGCKASSWPTGRSRSPAKTPA